MTIIAKIQIDTQEAKGKFSKSEDFLEYLEKELRETAERVDEFAHVEITVN